ncbi:hypothetical protein L596_016227 [Steinernema carpocapsae]|uniref:G-protein coupled receptors family 1 profile domain-containing protein n=1 Tax=Steinernema carpocapsae TaxID=34508 RepID=A0A4U5NIC3_STECR|nr:hypothetical protein L596_016227 [Steinernema carpocapsae]
MVSENLEIFAYVAEGFLVVAANFPVALVIFFSSKFKSAREFTFIGGLCLADSIYGLAYFIAGVARTHMYASGEDKSLRTLFDCYWLPWMFLSFIGYQSTAVMTLLVSLDRLAAAYFPTWHLNVMTQRKKTFIVIGFFFVIFSTAPFAWYIQASSAQSSNMVYSECFVSEALISQLWSFVLCFRIVTITASCLVCIPIAKKIREITAKNAQGQKSQLSKHRKLVNLTVTIALTTTISLVFLVVPDVVFLFNIGNLASKYHLVFYLISLNNCVLNVVVYNLRHRELRRAVLVTLCHCLGRRDAKVSAGKRVLFSTSTDQPTYTSTSVALKRPTRYQTAINQVLRR